MEDASVLPFSEWAAWVSELAARARASIVGSEGLDWYGMRMLARWDPVVRFHSSCSHGGCWIVVCVLRGVRGCGVGGRVGAEWGAALQVTQL
jgi:hypothetical protein